MKVPETKLRLDDHVRRRTLDHVSLAELESADGDGSHREVVPGGGQGVGSHTPFQAQGAGLVGGVVQDLDGGEELEVSHSADDGGESGDHRHSWKKKHSKSVLKCKIC